MDREQEFQFVYEHGVLRPEAPLDMPEGTRGIARVREVAPKDKGDSRRQAALRRVRARAVNVELLDKAVSTDAIYGDSPDEQDGR